MYVTEPFAVKFQLIYIPKMLAVYIQYNSYFEMYIPQPCAQRVRRNPPTDIFFLIVGKICPIQIYIK